ncbi:MAG: FixH family protein [Hydrogenibacillus sp.]|nr:FixH family protein [Hydrogenibacillus sp.]
MKRNVNLWGLPLGMLLFALALSACGTASNPQANEQRPASSGGAEQAAAPDVERLNVELIPAREVLSTGEAHPYRVVVTDQGGQRVDADRVYLFLNMEGMHHPTEGTMRRVGTGEYELRLPLAMPGEWYAEVTISAGGKEKTFTGYQVRAEGKAYHLFMKGYNADTQGELPEGWKPDAVQGSADDHGVADEGHGSMTHDPGASADHGPGGSDAGPGDGQNGGGDPHRR